MVRSTVAGRYISQSYYHKPDCECYDNIRCKNLLIDVLFYVQWTIVNFKNAESS